MPINFDSGAGVKYPDGYKEQARALWYKSGRPAPIALHDLLPPEPISGTVPGVTTLRVWVHHDWKEWAEEMDAMVEDQIKGKLVEEKVAMFERFTKVGQEMQDLAIEWLNKNKDKMNAIAAVRLLVDGIRIEQEARGVPQVLRKLITATDEDLLKRAKELLTKAPMLTETIEINENAEIQD